MAGFPFGSRPCVTLPCTVVDELCGRLRTFSSFDDLTLRDDVSLGRYIQTGTPRTPSATWRLPVTIYRIWSIS